jgi:AP-4 complex subunit beta-1
MASYPGEASAGSPPAGGAPGAIPDSYFTESRKGEINELRTLLRGFSSERDPQRKRDIIKKVIAYMTLGIDVSRLFSEMMMAIETRDLVIKKMVYLYLTNYARSHPELAQMCTNTLQKDCGNEDPMVRGLALRALCGLQLPQMVEYISEPLRRSLTDHHAYVRKTGVMGILKLYHLDPDSYESSSFNDILYDMLLDPDASVVANCIIVLNEVMAKSPKGGMAINRAIMLHLLNRIHEFNEFAKVQVLELVPRYIPANEDEGFQIMNLLDPVLRTGSSAAVMATISAFLSLAEQLGDDMDTMKRQIIGRVKAPLVTQISSGSSEIMYTLLKHVEALTDICPGIFDDEYRQFYVRYNEPTHVKYLKIAILPKLANPDTAPDIVSELAECVWDSNTKTSRLAVRSMAQIACTNQGGPGAAESISRRLVEMLDIGIEHVSSEAATALTLILRKQPALKTLVAPPLVRSLKYISEPSGKASIIFMLGECGEIVNEVPYALEKLIDTYEDIEDCNVKLVLLGCCMKLFFLRPPEMQKMLGRLLAKAIDDVASQDLHDRALLYYRMLRSGTDPKLLENIVKTNTVIAEKVKFSEEDDDQMRADLMEEFNTLSIIYGKTSENFIAPEYQVKYVKMPDDHPLAPGDTGSIGSAGRMANAAPVAPAPVPPPMMHAGDVDLLGFGGPPDTVPAPAPAPPSSYGISLSASATLSGEEYQSKWEAISDADSIVATVALRVLPVSTDQVERALAGMNVMTMASGELPGEFKFFLYAQDSSSGSTFLIQSNIEKTPDPLMIITIKVAGTGGGTDQQKVDQLVEMVSLALN